MTDDAQTFLGGALALDQTGFGPPVHCARCGTLTKRMEAKMRDVRYRERCQACCGTVGFAHLRGRDGVCVYCGSLWHD